MRSFVRAALEETLGGCVVEEARTGFEALRMLPQGPYDLIITDINMPDINGLELIRFVRERDGAAERRTPLVVISTESSARDRERGLALGADDYLVKPFGADALAAVLGRLLAAEVAR